ncbi:MAG: ABC transporter permease [Acidobacteria bacterium]|nr:ABC transporter permease [Acidobacteriota bacterium]
MKYQLFIALRYLKLKKRETFLSVLTIISIVGVAFGVICLVVAQALSTGTHEAIIDKIVGNSAHILIYDAGYSNGIPDYETVTKELIEKTDIIAASGVVFGWGLLSSSFAPYTAGFIYGIEPESYRNVTGLLANADIKISLKDDDNWILLANGLARKLQVKTGEHVRLVTAGGSLTPVGLMPVPRTFIVAGTFDTGIWQSGETWAFISRTKAQRMFQMKDRVNVIQAGVKDLNNAHKVAAEINKIFEKRLMALDWSDMNRGFYSALKLEKLVLFLTLGLIVLVASLNIISTLIVLVVQKRKSIGILRAMGADERGIMTTFILQGIVIGVIGTVIGLIIGIGLSVALDHFQLIRLDPQVYPIEFIRFKVVFLDCLWVVILALAISFVATIYPARRASRLKPAENLRNE